MPTWRRAVPAAIALGLLLLAFVPTTTALPGPTSVRNVDVHPIAGGAMVTWDPPYGMQGALYHVLRLTEFGWMPLGTTTETWIFDATASGTNDVAYGYQIVASGAGGSSSPAYVIGTLASADVFGGSPNCVGLLIMILPTPQVEVNGTCLMKSLAALIPEPITRHIVEGILLAVWEEVRHLIPPLSEGGWR